MVFKCINKWGRVRNILGQFLSSSKIFLNKVKPEPILATVLHVTVPAQTTSEFGFGSDLTGVFSGIVIIQSIKLNEVYFNLQNKASPEWRLNSHEI